MAGHDIIVIGASAGGVETLTRLVKQLPRDLPAAIFIVLHLPKHATSALPAILRRAGQLPVLHPADGETIKHGHIYVAPPDFHLLIKTGHIHLVRGPQENGHRPAIDPMFRTAARSYGNRVIGVVLSGVLDDGTAGLLAIKMRGGLAVVQDPEDAYYSGMPQSAIDNVEVDAILPLVDIPAKLVEMVSQPVPDDDPPVSDELEFETEIAEFDMDAIEDDNRPGTPAEFACPDCGGALFELKRGHLIHYRCRVGHAFSAENLMAKQTDAIEEALWVALRALEERGALSRKLANGGQQRGHGLVAARFEEQASEAERGARLIREVLLGGIMDSERESRSKLGKSGIDNPDGTSAKL